MNLDYLKDIVQHTHGLGMIELVKLTGTAQDTSIDAMSEDRSVIVQAKTHNPIPEFVGQFGMPNLSKLNVILGIPEYKEDAKITVTMQDRNGEKVPVGLHFENKDKNFKNDYRFMSTELINETLKAIKFKGVKWNVEFEPSALSIQRLKFYFGDHSSHAGNFAFADGVTGTVAKGFHWPISVVQGILNLPGDKTFRFSDEGAAQITVDSGLAVYNYTMPAQQK
jgi:hypothetical protein